TREDVSNRSALSLIAFMNMVYKSNQIMQRICSNFFFQAEDGIRDYKVTGVQTCALPIYRQVGCREIGRCCLLSVTPRFSYSPRCNGPPPHSAQNQLKLVAPSPRSPPGCVSRRRGIPLRTKRSEERRVGKERRRRVWREQE